MNANNELEEIIVFAMKNFDTIQGFLNVEAYGKHEFSQDDVVPFKKTKVSEAGKTYFVEEV